jgi:predicted permease
VIGDIRYAMRQLIREPGFAVVAILSLALGIGANTAIFSIVDAAIFRPLPYRDADRLVFLFNVEHRGTAYQSLYSGMTREDISDWRAQKQIFEEIESYGSNRSMALSTADRADTVIIGPLSPGMATFLGFKPMLGRGFTADDAVAGNDRVALLSDGEWRRAFGADTAVLGRVVRLDGRPCTIIGVMPREFRFPMGESADAWIPLHDHVDAQEPREGFIAVVAKLRPGLSLSQATQELEGASAWLQSQKPHADKWDVHPEPLNRWWFRGHEPMLLILLGAVGFVLLIACANVANLLLLRTLKRQREIAIRAAIGARPMRLVRQFLSESLLISTLGGVAGVFLAWWSTGLVPKMLPQEINLFGMHDMQIDHRVLMFTFAATILTGLLSGLMPALQGSRGNLVTSLAGSGRTGTTPLHRRARDVFLAAQVAMALVLLAGAGLLLNSFVRIVFANPGFDIHNLSVISLTLPQKAYPSKAQQDAFFEQLLEGAKALPQVSAATIGLSPARGWGGRFVAEGTEGNGQQSEFTAVFPIKPEYFAVLGIPMVAGRTFDSQDSLTAPPVAIIDREAARRHWPDQSALGKRFRHKGDGPWLTIVGVVGHVKTRHLTFPAGGMEIYVPLSQQDNVPSRALLFRSVGDPSPVFAAIRAQVRALDKDQPIQFAGFIDDMYDPVLQRPRFVLIVIAVFAALALATAAVGIFGTMSYCVGQRTHEIGVRIALGARQADVQRLILLDALGPISAGFAFGMLASLWITQTLRSLLYQVQPGDPWTLAAVGLFFLVAAGLAAILPAKRATSVDPIDALRAE